MKPLFTLTLFSLFFSACERCHPIAAKDLVSRFQFVNFAPEDIDTVYFICSTSDTLQLSQSALHSVTHSNSRIINMNNTSQFDIKSNGMPVNGVMHIFASDTSMHFIVKAISTERKYNSKCKGNYFDYINSVSVNGVPQVRTKDVVITK